MSAKTLTVKKQTGRGQLTVGNLAFRQAPLVAAGLVRDTRQRLHILERSSGRLEPGRLTLLLGAPASGKSTLLHALAGALQGSALTARTSSQAQ